MAEPRAYVVVTGGDPADAPAGAIPIALYGIEESLAALVDRVEALENAAP